MRIEATASRTRLAAAPVAMLLLAAAAATPVWFANLIAPQYPKGLWLYAYGTRLEGDLGEINNLNHYIGMRPLSVADVPELQLWLPALAGLAALALAGLFLDGRLGSLSRLLLWVVPFGILADIQRWLIHYGRDLDPEAALRLKPFVPLVIGPTQVWNFKIVSYPGPATIFLIGLALLVVLAHRRWTAKVVPRAALAAAASLVLVLAAGAGQVAAAGPGERSVSEIASAIELAPSGAEVRVAAGVYRGDLVVSKTVRLVGERGAVLLGTGQGTVVTIAAPGVTVHGFAIHASGGQLVQGAAVAVVADGATVSANHIADAYTGVGARGVRDLRVVGNGIAGRAPGSAPHATVHDAPAGAQGDGISLSDVTGALIRGNSIGGVRDGIYLSYVEDALVDGNEISGSRYGVHAMYPKGLVAFENVLRENAAGIVAMYGGPVEVARNRIVGHRAGATGYGLLLKDVQGVRVIENVLSRNIVGFRAEGVDRAAAPAEVIRNEVAYNSIGIVLLPTASLVFGANSFVENVVDLEAPGVRANRSEWRLRGVGNHWSGYLGYDLDGDNVGDVPHREGGTSDRLLGMAPELRSLRAAPAAFVLAKVDRWWSTSQAATIEDVRPLLRSVLHGGEPGRAAEPVLWLTVAGVLALAAAGLARTARVSS